MAVDIVVVDLGLIDVFGLSVELVAMDDFPDDLVITVGLGVVVLVSLLEEVPLLVLEAEDFPVDSDLLELVVLVLPLGFKLDDSVTDDVFVLPLELVEVKGRFVGFVFSVETGVLSVVLDEDFFVVLKAVGDESVLSVELGAVEDSSEGFILTVVVTNSEDLVFSVGFWVFPLELDEVSSVFFEVILGVVDDVLEQGHS